MKSKSLFPARRSARHALLISTMLMPMVVHGQTAPAPSAESAGQNGVSEIVVTAQKRSENLQKVPLSITVLNTEALQQLKVQTTADVIKFLPSVSFETQGPGTSHFFFRGIASGENFNHSAQQPTVGVYLDEQPITTITGELDIHMYDIARIEALAGPQGTLYGSSSEAGTLRIITNQPRLGKFEGGVDLTGSLTAHGAPSGVAEGFVNLPVGDKVAIRLVGWYDREGGYIDNIERTTLYPTAGITVTNADAVRKNFNDTETYGGRAAVKIQLSDDWSLEPSVQVQHQYSHGSYGYDKSIGRLNTAQTFLNTRPDRWVQAGLTIQGKVGSLDLTYAGSYLSRQIDGISDYADYAYFYDVLYQQVNHNNAGQVIVPYEYIDDTGERFKLLSQELRFSTDPTKPLRAVGGLFYERQEHQISNNFVIVDLGTAESVPVPGKSNVWYQTRETRIDRDYAAFTEVTYDITQKLSLLGGGRVYKYDNTLVGFTGYKGTVDSRCLGGANGPAVLSDTPCTDLGVLNANGSISPLRAKGTGFLPKVNVTYKFDGERLAYFTWSKGYRPGGINRVLGVAPYSSDKLTNFELGFKTSWLNHRLRVNGALYYEDWQGVQSSHIGPGDLTVIENAGDAHVKGFEYSIEAAPMRGLTINTSGSFSDARLAENYCTVAGVTNCTGANLEAPKGTRLPVTPRYKGTTFIRYEMPLPGVLNDYTGHLQSSINYQTDSRNDLRTADYAVTGTRPGFTTVDLEIGLTDKIFTAELFAKNIFDNATDLYRYAECAPTSCGGRTYAIVTHPREIGVHLGRKF